MNKIREIWNSLIKTLADYGAFAALFAGLLPAAGIVYLAYSLALSDAWTANEKTTAAIKSLEADNERGRAIERSQGAFVEEFRNMLALYDETAPKLPKSTELAGVIAQTQEAARRYNCQLTGLAAVREAVKSPNAPILYEREIPVTVIGGFGDVERFFNDLSLMERITVVRDFAATSVKNKTGKVRPEKVAVNFSLLAMHAPPAADFPKQVPPEILKVSLPNSSVSSSRGDY